MTEEVSAPDKVKGLFDLLDGPISLQLGDEGYYSEVISTTLKNLSAPKQGTLDKDLIEGFVSFAENITDKDQLRAFVENMTEAPAEIFILGLPGSEVYKRFLNLVKILQEILKIPSVKQLLTDDFDRVQYFNQCLSNRKAGVSPSQETPSSE